MVLSFEEGRVVGFVFLFFMLDMYSFAQRILKIYYWIFRIMGKMCPRTGWWVGFVFTVKLQG